MAAEPGSYPWESDVVPKFPLVYISMLYCALLTSGCVNPSERYRTLHLGSNGVNCDAGMQLQKSYNNGNKREKDFDWSKCYTQNHTIEIDKKNIPLRISYIEFDSKGRFLDKNQSLQLKNSIRNDISSGKRPYVVYFVHGWRNNASLDSGDIVKFHTLMAYMTSFIEQRCNNKSESEYCSYSVTGVYVGWPGIMINEPKFVPEKVREIIAAPTFPFVKERSEIIGPNVVRELQEQISDLRGFGDVRTLVLAHSAGGNLIMSGLSDGRTIQNESPIGRLFSQHSNNEIMESPLADLTVLINPASAARRWVEIQERSYLNGGYRSFPIHQKPVLISITSACGTRESKKQAQKKYCDYATYYAFALSQIFLSFQWFPQDRTAIGHYVKKEDNGEVIGASHAIEDNSSGTGEGRRRTKFREIGDSRNSECIEALSWLFHARERAAFEAKSGPGIQQRHRWDVSERVRPGQRKIPEAGKVRPKSDDQNSGDPIFMQSRFGIYGGGTLPRIDSNNPFWNMRADSSAQTDHGGYVSYPLLCHLTQLWLDPVT